MKIFLWILGGLAAILTSVLVYLKLRTPAKGTELATSNGGKTANGGTTSATNGATTTSSKPNAATAVATTAGASNGGYLLKKGSTGADVQRLQRILNRIVSKQNQSVQSPMAPESLLTTDGQFGAQTEAKLLKYWGQKEILATNFLLLASKFLVFDVS